MLEWEPWGWDPPPVDPTNAKSVECVRSNDPNVKHADFYSDMYEDECARDIEFMRHNNNLIALRISGKSRNRSNGKPGTMISDLSPISNNTTIEVLSIHSSNVKDLTQIMACTSLTHLSLTDSLLTSIPLFTSVAYVDFSHNQLKDISPLRYIASVVHLNLSYNEIDSIECLRDNRTITNLRLDGNPITSIEPLRGNSTLIALNLDWCELIDSIECLRNNRSITDLHIESSGVKDLSPLYGNDVIEVVFARDNGISDISSLRACSSIRHAVVDDDGDDVPHRDLYAMGRVIEMNTFNLEMRRMTLRTMALNEFSPKTPPTNYGLTPWCTCNISLCGANRVYCFIHGWGEKLQF
jgi:Leucine-rich repeat (LRR) protein